MSDSSKLATLSEMFIGQWSRKGAPTPFLDAPIDEDDTTLQFSAPLKDEDGNVVTAGFPLGIRKSNGWVEQCWVPAGGLSADGLTATGVVRGVDPAGLDYTTGSADFADEHEQGEPVFCNIPAFFGELLRSALQGLIATGGTSFIIGPDSAGTVTLKRSSGAGASLGMLRWSSTNTKVEYSNNGVDWVTYDDLVASVLTKVSSNDTTPGYLDTKITVDASTMEKTIVDPAGDERLNLSAHGNLADMIDDVTSTAAEIDQAVTDVQGLSQGLLPVGFYPGGGEVTYGILGDEITADDITNNRNLVYQLPTDMKWYKVTSTASTWYYKLGLALEAGAVSDNKRVLLKGRYQNQTFANINPTFSSALTGADINVGQTDTTSAAAFLIDNSAGAECVVTGGTISAKQTGAPSGEMRIYLVLNSYTDQTDKPACFFDATNYVVRGAIIASATIAQATFSGVYQALPFSFSGNVKIPAGCKAHLVIVKAGAVDAGNYYQVQSSGASFAYNYTTQTWSGTENAGNLTLTVTSTSPVGYGVKAYNGTDGNYGLTPTNPWSKVIGRVLSATEMFFEPHTGVTEIRQARWELKATAASGYARVTVPYCPSEVMTTEALGVDATIDERYQWIGISRGDKTVATVFGAESLGYSANYPPYSYLGDLAATADYASTLGCGFSSGANQPQNRIHLVRLEDGFYAYCGYPATAALYLSAGKAGWANAAAIFNFNIKQ